MQLREFAWVFGSRVFVGIAANGAAGDDPRVREISDLHVTRIEDRAPRRKPAGQRPKTN